MFYSYYDRLGMFLDQNTFLADILDFLVANTLLK